MDAVEARTSLVIGYDMVPRSMLCIGVPHHLILGLGVIHPPGAGFHIHRAEFPPFGGVLDPSLEAAFLFFVAYGEPVLDEDDPGTDKHLLVFGTGTHEFFILFVCAKAHNPFDPGSVVPTPVEEDHLACRREMGGVTLEIPLTALPFRRHAKGDNAAGPRVEALRNALDDPTFSCGVPSFEQDDDFELLVLDPFLEFDKLDLEFTEFFLIETFFQSWGPFGGVALRLRLSFGAIAKVS